MAILKQLPGKSLFPDIEWSKPENSNQLGKLLIIGGSAHSIVAPSTAYSLAKDFGIASIRVIVPQSVKQNIPVVLPFLEFAPSNPSGSFGKEAISTIKEFTINSDCSFFCGQFGKNSETAIMIDKVIANNTGITVINGDGIDYYTGQPKQLLEKPNTILVASFGQLQKIIKNSPHLVALLFNDNLPRTVQKISDFISKYNATLITEKDGVIILADKENTITTNFGNVASNWQLKVASLVSCWSMTNKDNIFSACSTAIASLSK